jgi:hypothetical protein
MQVQIFMLEDNKELIYDADQLKEFQDIVSELGLKCHNHRDVEKSPIPYQLLDEATMRAFKILCPVVSKIKDYTSEIPLEVLRHIKLSETEKYFDWVEIWHNEKDPDPFAVGRVYKDSTSREKEYTWSAHHYLIGRWGAEAKPIPALIDDAVRIATDRIKRTAEATIAKMKSWQSCPETWAKAYIQSNNGETSRAIEGSNVITYIPF